MSKLLRNLPDTEISGITRGCDVSAMPCIGRVTCNYKSIVSWEMKITIRLITNDHGTLHFYIDRCARPSSIAPRSRQRCFSPSFWICEVLETPLIGFLEETKTSQKWNLKNRNCMAALRIILRFAAKHLKLSIV